jgi:hypothetical protein
MATGDITLFNKSLATGAIRSNVASGTTGSILPGEPVSRPLAQVTVDALATNKPVVGTDYVEGIAVSQSTETASAAGYVMVQKLAPGQIWLIKPKVAASWDTQTEYNALIGKRVLLDLTTGSWTILAADGATSGCVIEYLDVSKHPGQVAFSFRNGVSPLT